MSRVEWTLLEGDQVEALVAMFVNREHPRSIRITPSRGDGGVDILDRSAGEYGTDVVYQVKKYTSPLDSKQYDAIAASLTRLLTDTRWSDLRLKEWHLVLPWNPTPEAEHWLQELCKPHGLTPVWHGFDAVQQWAANYPDVVDYFLHGGAHLVREVWESVMAFGGLGSTGGAPSVPGLIRRFDKARKVLDNDPLYRYEFHHGDGEAPPVPPRPGLVLGNTWQNSATGQWATVSVISRCAASAQIRPITVEGIISASIGSESARHLDDFRDFGVPFQSQVGAFAGRIDAPGGIGGSLDAATIRVSPAVEEADDNRELRLEAIAPDGTVLAGADVVRLQPTSGIVGNRFVLRERNGVFEIEKRNNHEGGGSQNVRWGESSGVPVLEVRSALEFLREARPPNMVTVRQQHTPVKVGVADSAFAKEWPEEPLNALQMTVEIVDDLATIQQHCSTVVRVPDLNALTPDQIGNWRRAVELLSGADVAGEYPSGSALTIELDREPSKVDGVDKCRMPFEVEVGDEKHNLGWLTFVFEDAEIVDSSTQDGRFLLTLTTPDRRYKIRHEQTP